MIIEEKVKQIRALAYKRLEELVDSKTKLDAPLELLRKFPWKKYIPVDEQISNEEFSRMNIDFSPRGCFGRIVLALILVEKFFPGTKVFLAEVIEDELARRMKVFLETEKNPQIRKELARELLMYEEPHLVLELPEFGQFDPLSALVLKLEHPKIRVHEIDPWKVVTASMIHSEAILENDPVARDIHLQRAEIFAPLQVIKEAQAVIPLITGESEKSEALINEALKGRVSARMLWVLWLEFGDPQLLKKYSPEVSTLLNQEYESLLVQGGEGGNFCELVEGGV